MKKNISILVLLFFLIKNVLLAQNCVSEMPEHTPTLATASATYRGGILKIPVVVHVVYNINNDEENITDAQILSAVEVLNQDFRQKNNQSNLPATFKAVAADVEIEFYLANTDPKGNKTNGITRTFTTSANVWQEKAKLGGVDKQMVYFTALGGKTAWDTKRFLNIWVCKMPNGKSGFATFPTQTLTSMDDGVVIDYRFFGTAGVAAQNQPFHLSRTCTHEVGHFLNLQHIWGNGVSNDDCSGDDEVADTPKQSAPVAGCPSGTLLQCGKPVMYQNFMNYTNDACMSVFTEGQKQRMLAVLANERKDLVTNNVANIDVQLAEIQVFPNPADQNLTISSRERGQYFLFNLQGQQMANGTLDVGENHLDIANLPNGMYQIGIVIDHVRIIKKINIIH